MNGNNSFHLYYVPEELTSKKCQKIVSLAKKRLSRLNQDHTPIDTGTDVESIITDPSSPTSNQSPIQHLNHSQILLGNKIGNGAFSSVYSVKSIRHNNIKKSSSATINTDQVVVKFLRSKLYNTPAIFAACAGDLVKECILLSALDHENIISVKACSPYGTNSYLNGHHDAFFIVLEKLQITLGDKLDQWRKSFSSATVTNKLSLARILPFQRHLAKHNKNKINCAASLLQERLDIAIQLARAIAYLHRHLILHRDIKPDNIGFDTSNKLKIFDFDVSRKMPDHADSYSENKTFHLTRRVGSPRYMSPECARGDPYNLKADVYSFGLLFHELVTLEKPYDDIPNKDHDQLVFYQHFRPTIPTNLPLTTQSLMAKCWSPIIEQRPSMNLLYKSLFQQTPVIVKTCTTNGGRDSPLIQRHRLGSSLPNRDSLLCQEESRSNHIVVAAA